MQRTYGADYGRAKNNNDLDEQSSGRRYHVTDGRGVPVVCSMYSAIFRDIRRSKRLLVFFETLEATEVS
jgi:hypothetical protein